MPTAAEQLRQAREAQKLDVYQVAEITKLRTDHIRALESGQFDAFIAPVYIRGFARTYAKALKLDVPRLIADLDADLSRTEKFREPPPLSNQPRSLLDAVMLRLSRLNWRVVGIGLLVLVALAVVLTTLRDRRRDPNDALKDLQPGLYQPKKDQSGEKLPLPSAPAKR